jgi:hypothetical protein
MRVRAQVGPIFVCSVEKVSGGMFAIGHVVEKEEAVACGCLGGRVVVGVGACLFSSGPAKEEVVSKSANAT